MVVDDDKMKTLDGIVEEGEVFQELDAVPDAVPDGDAVMDEDSEAKV